MYAQTIKGYIMKNTKKCIMTLGSTQILIKNVLSLSHVQLFSAKEKLQAEVKEITDELAAFSLELEPLQSPSPNVIVEFYTCAQRLRFLLDSISAKLSLSLLPEENISQLISVDKEEIKSIYPIIERALKQTELVYQFKSAA
jgi:hypothetical protein